MRLLFWGTPEFAVPSLRALLGEGFDVVGVVTRPDRPRGRSRSRLVASPIKEVAVEERLTLLQPERPRGQEFVDTIRVLSPDVSIVVAYGHILPRDVIDVPTRGTFNVHASLLPLLRGAAPIQAAVRGGFTETGVSIIRLIPALDAGPVLLQLPTPIAPDETFGEVQLRLSELGAQALVEALALLDLGAAVETPQDETLATYAPKVDRAATQIDWSEPATTVAQLVRAYDPRPGAVTSAPSGEVKMFGAAIHTPLIGDAGGDGAAPGVVRSVDQRGLIAACGAGAVCITEVQPAGRARDAGGSLGARTRYRAGRSPGHIVSGGSVGEQPTRGRGEAQASPAVRPSTTTG